MSNGDSETEILASEPSSPFIHGDYAGLDLNALEEIINFEARTGGRIDAKIAQPVVEYYKALARHYQLQLEAEKAKHTYQEGRVHE